MARYWHLHMFMRGKHGQSLVEFAIVATFIGLSFFTFWQLQYLLHTRMSVRYADFFSARTASVWKNRVAAPLLQTKADISAQYAIKAALGRTTRRTLSTQVSSPLHQADFIRSETKLTNPDVCVGNQSNRWIRCGLLTHSQYQTVMPAWVAPRP